MRTNEGNKRRIVGYSLIGTSAQKCATQQMEDSLKKGKSQVARGSWKFCNASFVAYAGRIVSSGGSGRRADGKRRRNSAVRAEIRTRGAVHENENDRPAYSGILDPCVCVHRRGT